MKRIVLYLWQLPQNLLGLLFLLFIKGEERHSLNGITFYKGKNYYSFYTEKWTDKLGGVIR